MKCNNETECNNKVNIDHKKLPDKTIDPRNLVLRAPCRENWDPATGLVVIVSFPV